MNYLASLASLTDKKSFQTGILYSWRCLLNISRLKRLYIDMTTMGIAEGESLSIFSASHTKNQFYGQSRHFNFEKWRHNTYENLFTLTLTHNNLFPYRIVITYIYLVKKSSSGHGSTRVMSSNTVFRPLHLTRLLYLMNWKHFSWNKLILEEAPLILIN